MCNIKINNILIKKSKLEKTKKFYKNSIRTYVFNILIIRYYY